jgi:hypothetical protein
MYMCYCYYIRLSLAAPYPILNSVICRVHYFTRYIEYSLRPRLTSVVRCI